MKQCIRCDREYPETENFCELDGAFLLPVEKGDELPFPRNRYRRRDDHALSRLQ